VRLRYRARQFWQALTTRLAPQTLEKAEVLLSPSQMLLFRGMQPSEQAHALSMLAALQNQGEADPDLLVAALLHDAGKQRCPLRLWERVVIVLVQAASPSLVRCWGEPPAGKCRGWRKPFSVAMQHAEWGAALALEAGVSPLAAVLIRRHPQPAPADSIVQEDILLRKLQAVDDNS
jgi:hypothetical protein